MNRVNPAFAVLLSAMVLLLSCAQSGERRSGQMGEIAGDPWDAVRMNSNLASGRIIQTAVFSYKYGSFYNLTAITVMDINYPESAFKVVCLNPFGFTLLELEADATRIHSKSVSDAVKGGDGAAIVIARDIRRIYLDMLPEKSAKAYYKKGYYRFVSRSDGGLMVHEFHASGKGLMRKSLYRDGMVAWRVTYTDHALSGGELYPFSIVLRDFDSGYRLQIKLKEVQRL